MEQTEFKDRLKEFWDALREQINRNPRPIFALSLVIFFLFLAVIVSICVNSAPPPVVPHGSDWYYDLNTGRLFTSQKGLPPPIDAPSGPLPDGSRAGVRAHLFTHVPDPNESQYFIGFLETSDPNAPAGTKKLIRRLDDKDWVSADSTAGQAIIAKAFVPDPNGEPPFQYFPPD